ncbi:hypothetical protein CDAR_407291 [Caerostris darwini]|uniref:Uncharacterized protein n=1 Tax=Caerostris darwini TaxID=1538125 RepID=A0AAV4Q4I2_9ARAC|nr:hypothetical protein CDAR_407291 [Caerostris darwini]
MVIQRSAMSEEMIHYCSYLLIESANASADHRSLPLKPDSPSSVTYWASPPPPTMMDASRTIQSLHYSLPPLSGWGRWVIIRSTSRTNSCFWRACAPRNQGHCSQQLLFLCFVSCEIQPSVDKAAFRYGSSDSISPPPEW